MPSKKNFLKKNEGEDKTFTLTDYEFKYIRDLNQALALHTLRGQIISGFLTYVATTRLGYSSIRDGYMLQYEVDPSKEDHTLIVREVPVPVEG
jgi:hypothetical protein